MTLGELIAKLKRHDPAKIVRLGFCNPHSYRGDYHSLAFEPAENVAVGEMLQCAERALGDTFSGYRGGLFTMQKITGVYLAKRGYEGEELGPLLLGYMLNDVLNANPLSQS